MAQLHVSSNYPVRLGGGFMCGQPDLYLLMTVLAVLLMLRSLSAIASNPLLYISDYCLCMLWMIIAYVCYGYACMCSQQVVYLAVHANNENTRVMGMTFGTVPRDTNASVPIGES